MPYTVQKVIRREIAVRSGDDRPVSSGNAATRERILEAARRLQRQVKGARHGARVT
jgi:hypothetical protein